MCDLSICPQHQKIIVFKIISGTQPKIFQGRGGFAELGHFDKILLKTHKKRPHGEKFGVFFP